MTMIGEQWKTKNIEKIEIEKFDFDFDLIYSFFIQGNHFSAEHWSPSGPCVTYIRLTH